MLQGREGRATHSVKSYVLPASLRENRLVRVRAGILVLAWLVMAGLALADTVILADDMQTRPSPLQTLQQALDPDLDDLRHLACSYKSSDAVIDLSWPTLCDNSTPRAAQPASRVHSPTPLYQLLSNYRI